MKQIERSILNSYNRICLVHPKSIYAEDPMVYPPLGIWYVWAALEQLGCKVDYVDLSEDSLPLEGYDAYMVTGTAPQASEIKRIGNVLRDNGKVSFLGGTYAISFNPRASIYKGGQVSPTTGMEHPLLRYYDVIVIGEVDTTEAMRRVLKAKLGSVIRIPLSKDLSNIVIPNREAAFRYKAFMLDENGVNHRMTTIFTSRGCPFNCAFCETSTLWGRKVRWVPVELVEKEIDEIVKVGFTALMFYDDMFPLNKLRTLDILKILKKHHEENGLISRLSIRTDVIRKQGGRKYLQAMYDAGVREILAGVESGSNQIKKIIHKGNTIEDDTIVLHWCKEIGIPFKCSVILGLPGETFDTMEETRKWLIENRPDRVDVNTLVPFPGTPITDSITKFGDKSEYDICWDPTVVTEDFLYKTPRYRDTLPLVWTSELSREDIYVFRQKLLDEIKALVADGKSSSFGIRPQSEGKGR